MFLTIVMLASLIGGVGLFLLGMRLMTDGLKYAAGKSLQHILADSTSTPLRGIASGAFLTSLVQSSSAVTVATIGFVNAGLMKFSHAIFLVYGSNIGTTMTGWLVSLVGFHVNIKLFALPAIGVGMFMRLARYKGRRGAMGDVLAGFGVFFLGVDVLKNAFSGLGSSIQFASLPVEGFWALLLFVGIGFLLTLMMQSSSAAIAIILTAVAGGVVPVNDAAAVVIGANIGTTSTAALAALGATPNAKRLAGAHVIFNLVTGLVALVLLPFLLDFLSALHVYRQGGGSATTLLAMFHTTFNLLGILLILPLTNSLVTFLGNRFRTEEEDESVPRYLDHTVVETPVLAMTALSMELRRVGEIARRMAKAAMSSESGPSLRLKMDKNVLEKLVRAVGDFGNLMQHSNLPAEQGNQLPDALRVSGYYHDMAELSFEVARLQTSLPRLADWPEQAGPIADFKSDAIRLIGLVDVGNKDFTVEKGQKEIERIREDYRALKNRLLRAATKDELPVAQMVNCLELIARVRRIAEQAEKGGRYLDGLSRNVSIERDENDLGQLSDSSRESAGS